MAEQSAGRVSLHPCFLLGLWTASTEITGEGGTPALFLSPQKQKGEDEMDKEKLNVALVNGKAGAQAAYAKGNELMDKVGFLKNPLHKKVAWGVLCILALLVIGRIFGCGGAQSPFDVLKETIVALPEGDIETIFSHMYIPAEEREKLSKLSGEEAELLEKQIVDGFIQSFGNMSSDELAAMKSVFESMKHKSTKVDGDKAEVTYVMTVGGEEQEEKKILRKVDGEWKVDFQGF